MARAPMTPDPAAVPRRRTPMIADRQHQIVICCGSGGVGKTTTSAALALRAAEAGRKVVVLTIDPARRLAQSLGLGELDNTPRPVHGHRHRGRRQPRRDDARHEADVRRRRAGALVARPGAGDPLATRSTWPCPPPSRARRSTWRWRSWASCTRRPGRDGRWDLIVVDTPPARSALDFLDAPEHLSSLLDGRFLRLLLAPAPGTAAADERRLHPRLGGDEQGGRRSADQGPADLRRRLRGALRRLPHAGAGDLPAAVVAAHDVRGGGHRPSATRCARRRTSSTG